MAKEEMQIRSVEMGLEFRHCPACAYTDGFHNMFRKTDKAGVLRWCFICPRCSSTFDIGLTVRAEQMPT
jgi:hypothetical protein